MVVTLVAIAKSIGQQCLKRQIGVQKWQLQTHRTLILQSASQSVKLDRLSDSDSGNSTWILEVKLDRPETRNAIGKEMLRGLQQAFEDVSNERSANVLMICSAVPKVFCAGADLKERKTMIPSEVLDFVSTLRSTFVFLEALHIPTIAAIEGIALGGGLEMAMSCDIRICGEDAVLGLPETGLAIIPGAGGTQRLPRLVGKSIAKDLIFTGRKISGKDAESIGLVNYCVPAGEARLKALELARDINQKGPLALRMAKRAIDKGVELDTETGLDLEWYCYEQLLHTKDRLEGLAAFAERRKPSSFGVLVFHRMRHSAMMFMGWMKNFWKWCPSRSLLCCFSILSHHRVKQREHSKTAKQRCRTPLLQFSS